MNTPFGEIPHDYEIFAVELSHGDLHITFRCKICHYAISHLFDVHNFVGGFYDWFEGEPDCVEVTA